MSDPKNKMEVHEVDGITEHDNPLPKWWLATFYLSIAFSVVYFLYYELGNGPNLKQELAQNYQQQVEIPALEAAKRGSGGTPDDELKAALAAPAILQKGKDVYLAKCAACHGPGGEGSIGPNLTDHFYLNGDGSLGAIAKVIKEGVSAKGMPSWEALLSHEEWVASSAFVRSLKGKNLPGKLAQGKEYKN